MKEETIGNVFQGLSLILCFFLQLLKQNFIFISVQSRSSQTDHIPLYKVQVFFLFFSPLVKKGGIHWFCSVLLQVGFGSAARRECVSISPDVYTQMELAGGWSECGAPVPWGWAGPSTDMPVVWPWADWFLGRLIGNLP